MIRAYNLKLQEHQPHEVFINYNINFAINARQEIYNPTASVLFYWNIKKKGVIDYIMYSLNL